MFSSTHYASFDKVKEKNIGCIMRNRKPRIDVKDITGLRFGDLTAVSVAGRGKYRGINWLCKCDCGKECIAFGGHLRDGTRKSCGCRSEKRIFETGINRLFSSYKRMALRRNRSFDLTRECFEKLVTSNCFYCDRTPENELKRLKTKKTQVKYNGIDRFDPSLGYIQNNCVSCCYYCNHSKLDLTFKDWIAHLNRILLYQRITNGI